MPDDLTLGEVMRRLESIHQSLKEDLRELVTRLDGKVSMERYQLEQQAWLDRERLLTERVRAIEDARDQESRDRRDAEQKLADRRAADRRLIFTAIIAPILMLFLTLYLSARGAGNP